MTRAGTINGNLKPSVPYLEFVGATIYNFTESVWCPIQWGMEDASGRDICTSDFVYKASTPTATEGYEFEVLTTGLYRVDVELGVEVGLHDQYTEAQVDLKLTRNSIDVPYTGVTTNFFIAVGETRYLNQITMSRTVYFEANDLLAVHIYCNCDSVYLIEQSCRIRISYVPLGGWNNNSGGNIINRGVRR
jgi:hypothetical protein